MALDATLIHKQFKCSMQLWGAPETLSSLCQVPSLLHMEPSWAHPRSASRCPYQNSWQQYTTARYWLILNPVKIFSSHPHSHFDIHLSTWLHVQSSTYRWWVAVWCIIYSEDRRCSVQRWCYWLCCCLLNNLQNSDYDSSLIGTDRMKKNRWGKYHYWTYRSWVATGRPRLSIT